MQSNKCLLSEEDVRNKLVTEWLKDHGIAAHEFFLEFTFEIQFGHKTYRPRGDVLVKNAFGDNLLVIEVKSIKEEPDEKAKRQGISYARLLREGGIAPFVVVTNGVKTHIYDSITEESIDGAMIPISHPHVLAGYRVNCDDIALRSEALETLISLSPENLLQFCRTQVDFRVRSLKSNDLFDGKKYIPQLYIPRIEPEKQLKRLLDEENRRIILLVGPPQVGKTSFVCRKVEDLLDEGRVCLFYPAISMQKGLLEEICTDFQWLIGDTSPTVAMVHRKLNRVLEKCKKKMIIFIDGWNETDLRTARLIDIESERLAQYNLQIVISLTNVAAKRLLLDGAGNPSHVADAVMINTTSIPSLEIDHRRIASNWSIVSISSYDNTEVNAAYEKYSKAYNVSLQYIYQRTSDPFLLRLAMEQYTNQKFPQTLDEPSIIAKSLRRKAQRAVGLSEEVVIGLLTSLAIAISEEDVPLLENTARKTWGLSATEVTPSSLFEAALLMRITQNNQHQYQSFLDFYYGRERDYVISYWGLDWNNQIAHVSPSNSIRHLIQAIQTNAGSDALRWFFSQSHQTQCLKALVDSVFVTAYPELHSLLLSCLSQQLSKEYIDVDEWLRTITRHAIKAESILIKVEAVKLLVLQTEETEETEEIQSALIGNDGELQEDVVIGLLQIDDEFPLNQDGVGGLVFQALSRLHIDEASVSDSSSSVTNLMESLIDHSSYIIRVAATKLYGKLSPERFLSSLYRRILYRNSDGSRYYANQEHNQGINAALDSLGDYYHGDMCPGWLDGVKNDPQTLAEEYNTLAPIFFPIIKEYATFATSRRLLHILEDLDPGEEYRKSLEQQLTPADIAALKIQHRLPIDELDIAHNNRLLSDHLE